MSNSERIITPGALRVKRLLPPEVQKRFDPTRVLDKNGVKDLIADIVTHGGEDAPRAITAVSNLFFNTATQHGYSTPLSDYYNDSEERKAMLAEYETQVNHIMGLGDISTRERNEKLIDTTTKYQGLLTKQNLEYMLGKKSTAAIMAQTGARGNPSQLQQGTSSPIQSKKIDGTPIPLAITHSFAEGLTAAEQLAMSYWGRGNVVQAQLSTSKPGDMFKSITPNLYHEVVTVPDCHTANGMMYPISDKKRVMFHYEAGTNKLIDEAYYSELKHSGKTNVKVRTTLTCEAKDGVCCKCYGLNARGKVPEIGENVGVVAAQSASEVLTQMILSTKHDAKAGKASNPYELTDNLLTNPENFQDEAVISTVDGVVSKIEQTELKDHRVFVGNTMHFVPNSQDVEVHVGDAIKQGDPLSSGTVNPRKLTSLRGIGTGRAYMSNQLRHIYQEGGNKLDPRHFDLIARNLVKYVTVKDPGDTGFLPGQVVSVNHIHNALRDDAETIPTEKAFGRQLAEHALEYTPGTLLDKNHVAYLVSHGVKNVVVSKSGLSITPLVPGIKTAKLYDDNWVSRLAFKQLGKSLREAMVMGHKAETSGTDPITPYMIGGAFGEGKDGKY